MDVRRSGNSKLVYNKQTRSIDRWEKQEHRDIRGLQSALEIIHLSKTLDEARERIEIHIRELKQ